MLCRKEGKLLRFSLLYKGTTAAYLETNPLNNREKPY